MFKNLKGQAGMNIIEEAIGTFQNVSDQLELGIENCKEAQAEHQRAIMENEQKISTLQVSIERAESIRERLDKFLSN